MMTKTVLILGASGLLGTALTQGLAEKCSLTTHSLSSDSDIKGDLNDKTFVENMLNEVRPDCVINLVALTNVDQCEKDPQAAYLLNAAIVKNIAEVLNRRQKPCHLVHISTDMLYDSNLPNTENDIVLRNYYAYSKLMGELHALDHANTTILRTNFFGKSLTSKRTSFSDWVIKSLRGREPIKLFADVFFSPLSMKTLCSMIEVVIARPAFGVFNLGSREGMSKSEFVKEVARTFDLSISTATDVKLADLKLPIIRPLDMRMDVALFEKTFNVTLPTLEEEIRGLI